MDDMTGYLEKLQRDLLEQFRGKPNIEVFQQALARQLEELYEFFMELNTLRWLKNAEGVQLDGIGDIVVMSRAEALVVSKLAGKNVPMDDYTYRLYLAFKMHLNTSSATHGDVYRALKMFWDKTPLYYSEDPAQPATMFFSTPTLDPSEDVTPLALMPTVKAAGVALHFVVPIESSTDGFEGAAEDERLREFFSEEIEINTDAERWDGAATADLLREYLIGDQSLLLTDIGDYRVGAEFMLLREYVTEDIPTVETVGTFDVGAAFERLREYISEAHPLVETVASYDSGATSEFVKEAFVE